MTVLATVRNTGSHTAHNILSPLGEMHFLTEFLHPRHGFWFGHTESENLGMILEKVEDDPPLILNMRHPIDVAQSWIRRSKTVDHTFRGMWQNLFSLKETVEDSFWLPVDTPDRDVYFDDIQDRLGTFLNRDWTRKGVFTGRVYEWSGGMTITQVIDWAHTMPFDEFGYEF